MRKSACYSTMITIIPGWFLSVIILISAVHYDVAQAKSRTATAVACGKELQQQCSGVPVQGNNMLGCLQKAKVSRRCAAAAHHIVRVCDRDAVQYCQVAHRCGSASGLKSSAHIEG